MTTLERADWLTEEFETHRGRLRSVAFRMLGSPADADDAVQETWIRLSRSQADGVENLGGWLTTVNARVCLDMLRARAARREEPLDTPDAAVLRHPATRIDPEQEAVTADAVGLALLVVLDRLTPAERVALVLHDIFEVPFADIAGIVGRSPTAAKKLASRARARVRGVDDFNADETRRWEIVDAFLSAVRAGNFEELLVLLDPDVVRRADRWALPGSAPLEIKGAQTVAEGVLRYGRAATRNACQALIDGEPGLIVAPHGRLRMALTIRIEQNKIAEVIVIGEPDVLARLDIRLPTVE